MEAELHKAYTPFVSVNRRTLVKAALALILSLLAGYLWWQRDHGHSQRSLNERYASAYLKNLAKAESEFRAQDSDRNTIADFWTGDVAGLYRYGALIDRRVAEADGRPLQPLVTAPIPHYGYLFIAMDADDSTVPPEELRQDTDKHSGKVHHLTKFAFCAFPAMYGVMGRSTFIVNERGLVLRRDTVGKPIQRWPSMAENLGWLPID
jgi:hypothetical protein